MNPSTGLRVKSMIRALTDVIIPAIDPVDLMAHEQAKLIIGHLHLLLSHNGWSDQYERSEATALVTLARELCETISGGNQTRAAQNRLKNAIERFESQTGANAAREEVSDLNKLICNLIEASAEDGEEAFRSMVFQSVIDHGRQQSLRDRSWFALLGFDSEPEVLLDIPAMLQGSESKAGNTKKM